MTTETFPYTEVPDHLIPRIGLADPGTRLYRAYGPRDAFPEWWKAVCEICGEDGAVSPGGVAMFAKASRAAVHKRLKEGRLTAFCFHQESVQRTKFRKREVITTDGRPVTYIPVTECKAWAKLMQGLSYEERKSLQWGDGDNAGQVLVHSTKPRKKEER